ncbi:putative kinesin [Leptomonas pyrrhocoris]|uniref:Putative kinesin n=1 Tax=Leptomonas pyrrhocoris TaxID=157538 RepID=A0A0M9G5H1_LEPPY|nr:putative kinesin [Leptomonas pyrrhocoris]KPA82697.1 putative kinesin [Leptomonas pyrrhocoris]|eukprot:XP_015661136.1 putative kinesin [Leptomonas pyrrhocoris]
MLHNGASSARSRLENASPTASSARRPTSRSDSFSVRSSFAVRSVHATPTREHRTASTLASARRTRANVSTSSDTVTPLTQTQWNAMKVYVRVRPFSEREISQRVPTHSTVRVDPHNPAQLTILEPSRGFRPLTTHPFTRCFWSVFETGESALLDKVDTYLIGGMNSARRSRAQSIVGQPGVPNSVRRPSRVGPEADVAAASPLGYEGAGSAPVMVDANVSHPPYAGQDEVYNHVGKPIVDNTLDGYNGCIFAYGQTGSGKTFTMLGYAPSRSDIRARRESMTTSTSIAPDDASTAYNNCDPFESDDGDDVVDKTGLDPNELQGIIPRSCADLFDGLHVKREKDSDFTYRVEVSYYEIYNEKVFDLIRPQTGTDLKVRHGPTGPFIEDLASKMVNKEEDVARVIRKGMQERHTAATKFNDRSSRSHAILSFNIVQLSMDESDNAFQMRSKLNLVDLAGSERTGAAGAEGDEFHDGVKINQSLTVLGRVIDRLADLSKNKAARLAVPYRESKLTWVLSDSIGGNSQTSMIATISPHVINYEEMRQTILYASRAQQVVNEVHRNVDPMIMQLRELRAQIADLQLRLKEAGGSNYTNEYVRGLEKRVKELEWKCADQERTISQLRAELESAGIADPTLVGRGENGLSAAGAGDGDGRSGTVNAATYRRNNEQLQSELQSANKEIVRLQKELLESERKVPVGQQADADEKIARLQREVDGWRSTLRDYDAHLNSYGTFQWRWTTDVVFSTFEDKMNALVRQCQEMMMNKDAWVMDTLNRGESEQLRAAATIQRQHNEEVSALVTQYRDSLDKVKKEYAAKEDERLKRQREVSSVSELRNQAARDSYDMEKRRWAQENENMKLAYEEKFANMRAEYQEDLKRLRESLTSNTTERQRNTTSLQELQESHEAYVKSITDDMERERTRHENELARVKKQLSTELARKEEQLTSRVAQARRSEEEGAKLRRDNLKLQTDTRAREKQLNAEIKDLLVRQENMIAVACTIVNNYEKAPESLDRDIELLRAFVNDQDYAAFRAKAKELAYRDLSQRRNPTTTTTRRTDATPDTAEVGDEKKTHDVADIRSAIENMRRTRDAHQASMQRVKQDVYEQLTRSRGFQSDGAEPKEGGSDGNGAATTGAPNTA